MNDTMKDFLDEFFEEFQFRIDALAAHNDEGVRKELLFLLVENLILKYENRLQQNKKGILSKIFPFMNGPGDYDREFENQINSQIDDLINKREIKTPQTRNGTNDVIKQKFDEINRSGSSRDYSYGKVNIQNTNLLNKGAGLKVLGESKSIDEHEEKYSKTNIPVYFDLGLELDLLPNKGQDHLDYFILDDGVCGIILCDGVSADGEFSTELAQSLPRNVIKHFKKNFSRDMSLSEWKLMITDAINFGLDNYEFDKGASTLLIALIDPDIDQIYISWLGDGNLIYFNESMTGFSKLLTPHNDSKGRLTRVVTASGIIGEPSAQIISGSGGAIIISSDGYNLTNGRILKHFFQQVLRTNDIKDGLRNWTNFLCCKEEQLHPKATDDRSIGVIRWNTVVNQYQINSNTAILGERK